MKWVEENYRSSVRQKYASNCQGASVLQILKTSNTIWNGDSTNDKGSRGKGGSGRNENAKILIGIDLDK